MGHGSLNGGLAVVQGPRTSCTRREGALRPGARMSWWLLVVLTICLSTTACASTCVAPWQWCNQQGRWPGSQDMNQQQSYADTETDEAFDQMHGSCCHSTAVHSKHAAFCCDQYEAHPFCSATNAAVRSSCSSSCTCGSEGPGGVGHQQNLHMEAACMSQSQPDDLVQGTATQDPASMAAPGSSEQHTARQQATTGIAVACSVPASNGVNQPGCYAPVVHTSQHLIQANTQHRASSIWSRWGLMLSQLFSGTCSSMVPALSTEATSWSVWAANWMGHSHLPDSVLPEWARILRDRMSTRSAFCCMLLSVLLVAYCSSDLLRYSPEDLLLSHKPGTKPKVVLPGHAMWLTQRGPGCSMCRWLASTLHSCMQPVRQAAHQGKGDVCYQPVNEYSPASLPVQKELQALAQNGMPRYVRRRSTSQGLGQVPKAAVQHHSEHGGLTSGQHEATAEGAAEQHAQQQLLAAEQGRYHGPCPATLSQVSAQAGTASQVHMQTTAEPVTAASTRAAASGSDRPSTAGLLTEAQPAVTTLAESTATIAPGSATQMAGAANAVLMRTAVGPGSAKAAAALAAAKAVTASTEAVSVVFARLNASAQPSSMEVDATASTAPAPSQGTRRSRRRLVSEVDRGTRNAASTAEAPQHEEHIAAREAGAAAPFTRSGSGRSPSVPRRAALMSALKMMSSAYSQQQRRQQRQRRNSTWQGQHMYWLYQPQKPPAPEPDRPATVPVPPGDVKTRRKLMLIEVATMLEGTGAAPCTPWQSSSLAMPGGPAMMLPAAMQPTAAMVALQAATPQMVTVPATHMTATAVPSMSPAQLSVACGANHLPALVPGVAVTHDAMQQLQQVQPCGTPHAAHAQQLSPAMHVPVTALSAVMLQPAQAQQGACQPSQGPSPAPMPAAGLPQAEQQTGHVAGQEMLSHAVAGQPLQLPQGPPATAPQAQLHQQVEQQSKLQPRRYSLEEQQQQQAAQLQELAALQHQIQQQQQQLLAAQQMQGMVMQLQAGSLQHVHQMLGMDQQELLQALQQQHLHTGLAVQPQLQASSSHIKPNLAGMQRIVLLELIGQGASGQVYRGHWRGEDVAVKTVVFREDVPARRDRALLEAAVCQALQHPAVVRTYTHDIMPAGSGPAASHAGPQMDSDAAAAQHQPVDWKLYLVQELCQATLRAALVECVLHDKDTGAPYMDTLLPLLLDVASGMEYLHSRSVIHGDLKPENVLLQASPDAPCGMAAKITDFGLATVLHDDQSHVINTTAGGTPYYAAPEVVQHGQLTKASDVYSFGVLMWVTYRCLPPWVLTKDGGYAANKLLGKYFIGTPPPYVLLSVRCMSLQPEHRPSFSEVRTTLQSMLMCFEAGQPGLHPAPSNTHTNPLLPT